MEAIQKHKLNQAFPLVYYINLKERTDRREQIEEELEKNGIYAERFEAIKDEEARVGCWKSHLEILKEARSQNCNVFIFEDDAQILGNEQYNIDHVIGDLDKLVLEDLGEVKWDMLYLGGNILRPFFQTTKFLARLAHCQSTHAYGINKRMLDAVIKTIEGYPQHHLDVIYADVVVPNVKAYISVPMLAIQRDSFSDIEKAPMTYNVPTRRYYNFLILNERFNETAN